MVLCKGLSEKCLKMPNFCYIFEPVHPLKFRTDACGAISGTSLRAMVWASDMYRQSIGRLSHPKGHSGRGGSLLGAPTPPTSLSPKPSNIPPKPKPSSPRRERKAARHARNAGVRAEQGGFLCCCAVLRSSAMEAKNIFVRLF